jgi:beta-lactamase superfamily II metal-dependent hydrolase
MQPKSFCKKIGDKDMTLLYINKKTYLIDYGALCEKQNFYTNIDYSILPSIIKNTGVTRIDTLVLCKPSASLAKAVRQFAMQTNVKTIIVTTKSNCFKKVKEAFQGAPTEIIPMEKKLKNKISSNYQPRLQVISERKSEFTRKKEKAPAKTRAF